jgi:hypothetical protein
MATTAQGWVLLGILGVLSTGLLTVVSLAVTGLRNEMAARFDGVSQRFDGVSQRFDGVDRRLDALDRDVQALTDRVFRDRP